MPKYQITIGQATYEVESQSELTDAQAYQYALQQSGASEQMPPDGLTQAQLRAYLANAAGPIPPAPTPVAPKEEIPVLDAESQRHQNRNQLYAATGEQTPYGNVLAADRSLQEQINALKLQRADIYRTPRAQLAPAAKAARVREINDQIAALEDKQSSDPYATIGGTGGAIVGGIAGAAGGSVVPGVGTAGGALAGSMMGGFLGTLGGALVYANKQNMTPEQASDYLFTKGIESLAYDAVGNIVFMGGGKIIGQVAKNSAPGRAVVKLLGGDINLKLKAPREAYLPGERVFKETSEDQLRDATEAGAKIISSAKSTPSAGQLTGDPGFMESVVRAKDPGGFAAVRREQEDLLEARVAQEITRMRGEGSRYAGTDLRSVLNDTEAAVKVRLAPVWEELRSMRGTDSVDFSEVNTMARQLLADNANSRIKFLDGAQLDWVKQFAAAGERLSPAEAQATLSKMLAVARDAQSPTNPNSELGGFATRVAGMIRGKLDAALASDPKFAEARALYKDMMDTLYNPVLDAARRGGESAAGRKAIKLGEVEGVQALSDLQRLAARVDSVAPGRNLAATAGAAQRGAVSEFFDKYAGTPDALARLHGQMGNPDFRKTFEAAVPDATNRKIIENLSQAAQLTARNRGMSGSFGAEAGASSAGRGAGSAVGLPNLGSVAGRLLVMLASKDSARAFTKPELQAQLPRISAWLLHAARGSGRATAEAPGFVMDFYEQLKAEVETP